MKKITAVLTVCLAVCAVSVYAAKGSSKKGEKKMPAEKIQIINNAALASNKGPADYFTGSVRVDPKYPAGHESGLSLALVTFEPGARTAWHTHPKGQTLLITSGLGLVQQEGGEIMEVRPGDMVWFPAGVKHWHGATAEHAMSHYSIIIETDKPAADWMEKVTDKQYSK